MDPLTITVSAGALAGIALKLATFIHKCCDGRATTDGTLKACGEEVETLSQSLLRLDMNLNDTKFKNAYDAITIGNGQLQYMRSLQQTMIDCNSTLDSLQKILLKFSDSNSFARGVVRTLKLNFRASEIAVIRGQIQGHQRAIDFSLQMITLLLSADTKNTVDGLDTTVGERFSRVEDALQAIRLHLSQRAPPEIGQDTSEDANLVEQDNLIVAHLQEYVAVAEAFSASASEYMTNHSGSQAGAGPSRGYLPRGKRRAVDRWNAIDTPSEDSSSNDSNGDDFERSITADHKRNGEKRLLAKNYAQAEQSFERFLSRTANVADWPRIEILEVKLGLVQAYKCQAKYADAKAILEPCLALEGIHKSQKLSMMHTLAELYYLLEDYPTAKDHAATVARRRSRVFGPKSDIYYESVALLTMVLYKLDKTEDAEILQSRIHAEHPLHRMIRESRGASSHGTETTTSDSSQIVSAKLDKIRNTVFLHHAITVGAADVCALLLSQGADPNAPTAMRKSPLMDAIELKHADVAQCLIQHGAMLDLQGDAYEILIRKAVTTNDVATTAVLLKAAATFTKKAEVYGSLLHVAIPLKSDGIVELLIKAGADVNHIDSAGQTPLHIAVGAAKSEASMIRLLLSSHPDLNRQSEAGNTPLHSFFKDENRNLEVLELILQSRTNVNCKNSEEDTALHLAVKDGASRISEVRRLLSSGADPNVSDANQRGALHRLVLSGKADTAILDAVLRANANVTSRDKEGFTPLAIAVQIAACSDAVITQLAEAGSDLSAIDEQGRSISLHAVRRGRDKVVDHMLQKANSIILRPSGNELLLHAATEYGHYSIAKKLLEAGLSTSSRDSEGCQATFTAIRVRSNGYIPGLRKSSMLGLREQSGIAEPRKVATSEADDIALISTLLRHGADIHTRDRDNQTLLHCAINHCKSEIVRYLLQTPFFVEEVKHNQPASTRNYTSARQTNNNFMQSAMQIYGMDHWHINDKARTSIIRQLIVANTLCPAYVGDKAKDTLTQLATMYPDIQAQIKKLISG